VTDIIEIVRVASEIFEPWASSYHEGRAVLGIIPTAQVPMLARMDTDRFAAALYSALDHPETQLDNRETDQR